MSPAPQPGADPSTSMIMNILPIVLIFAVFYFLILRPQSKKQKELRKLLEDLKKGDRVITNSGLHGTIKEFEEVDGKAVVMLQISENCTVKFDRSSISGLTRKGS